MEPGRVADGLVVWRKGTADLQIDVKGRAVHAGVAPEAGRNAAMEAAHRMLQMATLGDSAKKPLSVSLSFMLATAATLYPTLPPCAATCVPPT
jgi:glutamate carboxypeptidase